MNLVVKQCVGCEAYYPCPEEDTNHVLYCSDVCENSHSILYSLYKGGEASEE